ncbi:benzoate/H(+) symporter BenE family transporter [Pseudarthrobacter sp. J75]|uniref:benzoate/H(+) symporter BenE family transporter n=1 Tax=Pseudarthrobacter sp. J75 TaxID=3116486 RepID=UPI002E818270|nr:benzoate/H(+) symporter BenE family transporter [Pseudarthrobacter sp. J75]MEE2529531.1 benzoate/H(+) symporter BenE family transporter [Pseudarthrobacter sp. J75]
MPKSPSTAPRTSPATSGPAGRASLSQPIVAGIVTALVGFTSSFAVVLAGLRAVGADGAQAASGLLALTLVFGLAVLWLAWRSRVPVTLAWSTPGAALLAAGGMVDGGWPAAVGAFILTGVLIALTGLVPALVLPVILCWLLMMRFAPRWSVPAALLVALAGITIQLATTGTSLSTDTVLPALVWTTPSFTLQAAVGIALPLFIVTMASQNIPGVAVLKSFGYETPWRPAMLFTGFGTAIGAPFGAHAINLAALSAALAAGEEAGPDRSRRWVAGFTSGFAYLVLAAFSAALVTLVSAAPAGLLEAVAGLALLATLAAAVSAALQDVSDRIPAVVTFLVAASGLSVAGIGAAFWALAAGLVVRAVLRRRPAEN